MKSTLLRLLPLLAASLPLNAAIIVFNDQAINNQVYSVNTATGVATVVPSGSFADGWGAAYDPVTSTLYWNSGSSLRIAAGYTGGALLPTSTLELSYDEHRFNVTGLAFDTVNSKLIGFRNINDIGFYEIDAKTGSATLLTKIDADFGGVDFDPLTGDFYGLNDAASALDGRGIYRIGDLYGSPTYTLLAAYPDGVTDIDGLAAGSGMAYLILDESGLIYMYNLVSNGYAGTLASPFTSVGIFSAGAYIPEGGAAAIPEPATLLLAGCALAAGVLLRRRRA